MSKGMPGRGGDGLIYLGLHNGKKRWEARLYWIDERTGKTRERRRKFYANSKLLALQRRAELLDEARGVASSVLERTRFEAAADSWFATIKVKATRHSWGSHKKQLVAHFGEWWLDTVNARSMRDYLDAMAGSAGYVNSRLDVLRHIFEHGIRNGWAASNPTKDIKKRSTRLDGLSELGEAPKRALSEDEAQAYLTDMHQHEPEAYPLALTQLVLGCRFSEASALRREDVDLESGIVKIRRGQYLGEVGRTKGKYARTAGLPLTARVLLKAHMERMAVEQWDGWRELVFPRPPYGRRKHSNHWSGTTLTGAIRRSFARCGLTDVKGKTHVARHTMITLTSDHAAESLMRKVVGHTTAAMNQKYQHPSDAKVIDFADVVGRRVLRETGTETGSHSTADRGDRKETP